MYVLFYTNYWMEGLMFIESTTPPLRSSQVFFSGFSENPPLATRQKKRKKNDLFACFFSESVVYLRSNKTINKSFYTNY